MQELDDNALLRRYAEHDSEEAFATLVARHVNKVYSVAWRHTHNPHQAEEISQAVFVILAHKARNLGKRVIVSGWLYQTARLTAVTFLRTEVRRAKREQEAYMQHLPNESESDIWPQIAPLLDAAMAGLNETDRHAVVLRFFDGKSMREVGTTIGANEDAAKMRVNRAVEKLRSFFTKRGVTVSSVALTASISANSVQAAPAMLAKTATAVALVKGATASTSTLALMKGATKLMAWTNAKMALTVGAIIVLAAGTATVIVAQGQAEKPVALPKTSWTFAGYGSPEATMRTMMWGISRMDGKVLTEGLSSDCREDFRDYVTHNKPGMSVEAFVLERWVPMVEGISDIDFTKREKISTDEVVIQCTAHGGNQAGDIWLKFKKFGDDWKIDDFDPKGPNGRTGLQHTLAQYGGIGIALEMDPAKQVPRITKVLPALAQSQTNLVPGLILQKINGTPTAGKSLSQCVFMTRGRVGTEVVLELFDPKSNQTNTMEINRKRFAWPDMAALGIR